MELRRLKYFLAVAEELHFGRAAERLHMAQPPLSAQIRKLEEELGVQLFLRTSRAVALTEAGRNFYAGARRTVGEIDKVVLSTQRVDRGELGRLSLGFVSSLALTVLPRLMQPLRATLPGLELDLRQYSSGRTISEDIERNALDLGFIRPPAHGPGVVSRTLLSDPAVLAVPSNHWLAQRRSARVEELSTEGFILFSPPQGLPVHQIMLRICRQAGFEPVATQRVDDVYAMLGLVAAGLGIAFLPSNLSVLPIEGVVIVALENASEGFTLDLAWRADDRRTLLLNCLQAIGNAMPGAGLVSAR